MHIRVIQLQYKNILISFGLSFVNWFLLCKLYNLYIYIYTMFLTRVPSWFVMIIILGRLLLYYEINIFLRYVVKSLNLKLNRYLILCNDIFLRSDIRRIGNRYINNISNKKKFSDSFVSNTKLTTVVHSETQIKPAVCFFNLY